MFGLSVEKEGSDCAFQVLAILQHYSPSDDFEERDVDAELLAMIQQRLNRRAAASGETAEDQVGALVVSPCGSSHAKRILPASEYAARDGDVSASVQLAAVRALGLPAGDALSPDLSAYAPSLSPFVAVHSLLCPLEIARMPACRSLGCAVEPIFARSQRMRSGLFVQSITTVLWFLGDRYVSMHVAHL